jgi:hypothetical protein
MLAAHYVGLAIVPVALASCATPSHPRITQVEAIRIAKRQFDKDLGNAAWYHSWTAEWQHDCTWLVIGHTPPDAVSGDARVGVDAETGKAVVGPIVQTDKEKLRRMKIIPASNHALQPTAGRFDEPF